MSDVTPPIAELFYELVNFLATKVNQTPLETRVYVDTIDADWSFAFNCTMVDTEHDGFPMPPMTFVLNYREFPAGMIGPFDGMIVANGPHGEAEQQLLAAIAAASVPA